MKESPSNSSYLASVHSRRVKERGLKTVDTIMLQIPNPGSHLLVPLRGSNSLVRILEPFISFEVVRDWLKFCYSNHTKACASTRDGVPAGAIPYFRRIDCNTGDIVPGDGIPYVALSYVWGANAKYPKFSRRLPDIVPNTIQDAITATLEAGLQYIWIDQYCINQDDRDELQALVSKMDLIYNLAQLTIIAAAGVDSEYGLPGVRARKVNQPQAKLGYCRLVSVMEDPANLIKESRWFSRGWTYQEGVLSRRRLVFTEEQAYFECAGMHCSKSVNLPLHSLHTKSGQRFQTCHSNGLDMGIFPRSLGGTGWEVVKRIQEYSSRTLTNPDDILYGMSGIFSAIRKGRTQTIQCIGVPILPRPPKPSGMGYGTADKARETHQAYEWSLDRGFGLGLCWDVENPTTRRPSNKKAFPSWTWAGWMGPVKWEFDENSWRLNEGDEDLRVEVELCESPTVPLDEFTRSYDEMNSLVSGILRITGWVTTVELRQRSDGSLAAYVRGGDGQKLNWGRSGDLGFKFTACDAVLQPPARLLGIHVGQGVKGNYGQLVLVVSEGSEGVYQRVGLGRLTWNNMEGHRREEECLYRFDQTPPVVEKALMTLRLG